MGDEPQEISPAVGIKFEEDAADEPVVSPVHGCKASAWSWFCWVGAKGAPCPALLHGAGWVATLQSIYKKTRREC